MTALLSQEADKLTAATIPLDEQSAAASLEAVNARGGLNRHRELAKAKPRPQWNADLLPSEERHCDHLDAVARTMRWLAYSQTAAALRAEFDACRKAGAMEASK